VKDAWTWVDGSAYGLDPLSADAKELWRKATESGKKNSGTDYLCGGWGAGGVWDDSSCDERKPFMCRLQAAPPNPPSPPPLAPGGCTDTPLFTNGYVLTCADFAAHGLCADGHVVPGKEWAMGAKYNYPEHNCCVCGKGKPMPPPAPLPPSSPAQTFVFHSEPQTFDEARKTCMAEGGDLASLHSVFEVRQGYQISEGVDSWLGLSQDGASGAWAWTDGSAYGKEQLKDNGAKEMWNPHHRSAGTCGRWGWGEGKYWDAANCHDRVPFTCRYLPAPPAPPATPPLPPAPPGAPPPPPSAPSCFKQRPLVVNEGRGLAGMDGETDAQKCMDKCNEVVGCNSFALCKKGPGCWMKDRVISETDATNEHTYRERECFSYFKAPCGVN